MAYIWTKTGDLDMNSVLEARDDETLENVGGVKLSSSGRPYRRYGVKVAPIGATVLRRTGVIAGSDAENFWDIENSLRGMHGTRQIVRRERLHDGSVESAESDISVSFGNLIGCEARNVTITATLLEPFRGARRGETPVWGSAEAGDGWIYGGDVRSGDIGSAVTLANGGNYHVDDAVITIDVTSGSFTSFTFSDGGDNNTSLILSATAGDSIDIDCAARTVSLNGTLQSAILGFASSHRHGDWLRIPSGGTDVTVSGVGGGSGTHSYKYREAMR